ncbi:MAG: hypothetical protein A3I44_03365 [Candidatus Sungbacteria bacterium RIFCSPLOWO2_02_FULL_51_17]|uniref:Uncharacterized protein n=1 Tax=Candidatus Sungbacteria bacterium RIFCSPHIGHO2_02_FULL_51_29 TaxID=1802273 RepID=A0A1G2KP84_9BACT|nr:MAG: hypothetical protein A2676_01270 [Candidatus Sungbacteria bacterium RIFCSPHIGHO2_01_FULL_51_22]OHA01217.1 MAG: hypothetical protein A3C16_00830 [Candidatus Sungbacteria bacterium RIFCSPHIGHO2_02_FULL_51_29]OHA04602.1 MAG: hypothetical protein A3B29_04435 [Candidatus Sungbacteria bacterium RIFCSPLOWO2_01_FULL_51_34]OHA12289.1 MAG: hypothetical protein A3I44_03365 [Candidatus Sungbacteria bacterium RIFCSPLOWO2_02_FULL_51_17]
MEFFILDGLGKGTLVGILFFVIYRFGFQGLASRFPLTHISVTIGGIVSGLLIRHLSPETDLWHMVPLYGIILNAVILGLVAGPLAIILQNILPRKQS